jgi:hypothetical protein
MVVRSIPPESRCHHPNTPYGVVSSRRRQFQSVRRQLRFGIVDRRKHGEEWCKRLVASFHDFRRRHTVLVLFSWFLAQTRWQAVDDLSLKKKKHGFMVFMISSANCKRSMSTTPNFWVVLIISTKAREYQFYLVWLTISRSSFRLILGCFQQDLSRKRFSTRLVLRATVLGSYDLYHSLSAWSHMIMFMSPSFCIFFFFFINIIRDRSKW